MKREDVKASLAKLRAGVDPKFKSEVTAIANSLDELLDSRAKGGRERSSKLTPKRRSEIARKAARVRWKLKKGKVIIYLTRDKIKGRLWANAGVVDA